MVVDLLVYSIHNNAIVMIGKTFNLKKEIAKLDHNQVGLSVASFFDQIQDAAKQFGEQVKVTPRKYSNIIFCGMGGSALGADFLRSVYGDDLKVPLIISHRYHVPAFADKNSLVVVCSYSGTTEEPISCLRDAKKRKLSSFVIAKGKTLARNAKKMGVPAFIFKPNKNPSKQPRIGTGYTLTGLYMLIKKMRLLRPGAEDLVGCCKKLYGSSDRAYQVALKTRNRSLVIIAASHLEGNAHILSNQMNESAKVFAPFFFISELNHHLLEGFDSLLAERKRWKVFFLNSDKYRPRIQKRFKITKKVLVKQGFATETVTFSGTKLEQGLKALSFSGWLTYYLAIMKGFDPAAIPWVDYFKKQMK
jgi:glucose/mannose-6-phosphate isomerase